MSDEQPGAHVSGRWATWRANTDLDEYHSRWDGLAVTGRETHGEADFIAGYRPASVLDAGCGMGRVAMELHRRGLDVEGADLDSDLLAFARRDAPDVVWHLVDLSTLDLGRTFSIVAMPGNVMIFCAVHDRAPIVARAAAHLEPGGLVIAGFGLEQREDALSLAEYDVDCATAGLELHERFATWERAPYAGGDYAVSVHRKR